MTRRDPFCRMAIKRNNWMETKDDGGGDRHLLFYKEIHPVILCSYVVGLFPLKNALNATSSAPLTYRFFGWSTLYTIALYGVFTSLNWFIILQIPTTDDILLINFLFSTRGAFLIGLCLFTYRRLPQFMESMDNYDRKLQAIGVEHSVGKYQKRLLVGHVMIVFGGMALYAFSLIYNKNSLRFFSVMVALVANAVTDVPYVWSLLLYVVCCKALRDRFHDLDRELQKIFKSPLNSYKVDLRLEPIRVAHAELCSTCYVFTTAFSLFISGFFLVYYITCIFKITLCIAVRHSFSIIADGFTATRVSIVCFIIIEAADDLQNASRGALNILKRVPLMPLSTFGHVQIKQFTKQADHTFVSSSASGYFTVNKLMIPVLAASLANVTMIVIQLAPQLEPLLTSETNSTAVY